MMWGKLLTQKQSGKAIPFPASKPSEIWIAICVRNDAWKFTRPWNWTMKWVQTTHQFTKWIAWQVQAQPKVSWALQCLPKKVLMKQLPQKSWRMVKEPVLSLLKNDPPFFWKMTNKSVFAVSFGKTIGLGDPNNHNFICSGPHASSTGAKVCLFSKALLSVKFSRKQEI